MALTTSGSRAPSELRRIPRGSFRGRRCRGRWATRALRSRTCGSSPSTPRTTSSGCAAVCRAARARSLGSERRVIKVARAHLFDAGSGERSDLDLSGPLFETEPKEHVIHRAVVAELDARSEEHTSELQSRQYLVCRLLLEKKKHTHIISFL